MEDKQNSIPVEVQPKADQTSLSSIVVSFDIDMIQHYRLYVGHCLNLYTQTVSCSSQNMQLIDCYHHPALQGTYKPLEPGVVKVLSGTGVKQLAVSTRTAAVTYAITSRISLFNHSLEG